MLSIGYWDLETSALNGSFGQILMSGVSYYNKKGRYVTDIYTLSNYENARWDDRELALRIKEAIEQFDVIVTYNGKRFDEPFLRTRLADPGLNVPGPILKRHVDLYWVARNRYRLHSNSLENFSRFLGVKTSKTRLDPRVWRMAICGHKPSYDYIIQHCVADVKVLAECWDRVKDNVAIK